jgi:hypothetical protein
VWSAPAGPLQGILRKEAFADEEPDVRIEDPLSDFQPPESMDGSAGSVPTRLEELEDVHLAGQDQRGDKKRETYVGHARTRDGETVLLTLRRGRRGAQESLGCVPLPPLDGVIDTEALFSMDFEVEIPEQATVPRA